MPTQHSTKIIRGISTSMLLDMSIPNSIYQKYDEPTYAQYMMDRANSKNLLPLGKDFKQLKLLFNAAAHSEAVLISRNSPLTARLALMTLEEEGIIPERMLFTCGKSPSPFLHAYNLDMFVTTNEEDTEWAQKNNILSPHFDFVQNVDVGELNVAKKIETSDKVTSLIKRSEKSTLKPVFSGKTQEHYLFDLDGVVFDSASEEFYQKHGLESYSNIEKTLKDTAMEQGPAFNFFKKLNDINKEYSGKNKPFKISVVTARGHHAAARAIETLHQWGIDITGETHFLGGASKGPVLEVYAKEANDLGMLAMFLDDQGRNVNLGTEAGLISGRVPSDLFNPDNSPKDLA